MSSRKYKGKLCVYCGTSVSEGPDHVPAKSYFAAANRTDLIKVPSCTKCNGSFSNDDEYFKTILTMHEGFDKKKDASEIIGSVIRSLEKPQKRSFLKAIQQSISYVERAHPLGLYTGRTPAVRIDVERLHRVAERITRALFYHEMNARLPARCKVVARWANEYGNDLSQVGQSARALISYAYSGTGRVLANGAFSYWFKMPEPEEHKLYSLWFLCFYEQADFLCITDVKSSPELEQAS